MPDDKKSNNVVDIANARQRQRTLRGATGRPFRQGAKSGKAAEPGKLKTKIFGGIQILLFFAILAYLLHTCGR